MKVLLDPQVFLLGYCGLLKYYSFLYKGLKEEGIDIYSPVIYSATPFFDERYYPFPGWFPSAAQKISGLALKRMTRKIFYNEVSKKNYDVLFITSDQSETGFLDHIGEKPFIMTVHDTMIGVNGKGLFLDPFNHQSLQKGYLAHKAKRIISISEHTTRDLETRFLIEPDKISTIHHTNFLPDEAETIHQLPEKYLLFIGNRNGRKNFLGWIRAVAPILNINTNIHVLITGKPSEYEQFFFEKLEIKQQIRSLDGLTDPQLNYLYRNALCLVYPSLYEGFGLPVLEAMANGCPVITTKRSSIPEVGGNAVLYVDPESDESMRNGLKRIIYDTDLRKQLSEKGRLRSKSFDKDKFIQNIIGVLNKAIQ